MADNLPPSCAFVTKSGNLNFLAPSGPVQACNGTALPFYICVYQFLHVLGDYELIIRRNNCVCVTLGTCYSVWMTLHTRQ